MTAASLSSAPPARGAVDADSAQPPFGERPGDGLRGSAHEALVPIRIDVQQGESRIVDAFTWNLRERAAPEQFAAQLIADLQQPPEMIVPVADAIREQVEKYVAYDDHSAVPYGGEHRRLITLNIRIGRVVLEDAFEWDVRAGGNDPERFARALCRDLGLGTDFVSAVAHAIREQLHDAWCDGSPYARSLDAVTPHRAIRDQDEWSGPNVRVLNAGELEEVEKREVRDARAMRRSQRRSGIIAGLTQLPKRRPPAPLPPPPMSAAAVAAAASASMVAGMYADEMQSAGGGGGRGRGGRRRIAFAPTVPATVDEDGMVTRHPRRIRVPRDEDGNEVTACVHCGRHPSKTPLMRVGPANRKNEICNSCGLFYRKYGELPATYKGVPIGPGLPPPPGSQADD